MPPVIDAAARLQEARSGSRHTDMDLPGPEDADAGAAAPPALRLITGRARDEEDERMDRWAGAVALDQDRDAFSQLFTAAAPRLKGWLVRSGSADDVAEEIVQDTFVIFWRKAALYDASRAGVIAWLFAIARNLRIDRHRSRCDTWQALDDEVMAQLPDPGAPVEEQLSARQRDARVREALARLGSDDRQYLQWSFFDEKSHSHIAQDLGIPLGTVKTRIRRAATKLRLLLEGARP